MSLIKRKLDEAIERGEIKTSEKWTTRKCIKCGKNYPKSYRDWKKDIERDVDYCPECMRSCIE